MHKKESIFNYCCLQEFVPAADLESLSPARPLSAELVSPLADDPEEINEMLPMDLTCAPVPPTAGHVQEQLDEAENSEEAALVDVSTRKRSRPSQQMDEAEAALKKSKQGVEEQGGAAALQLEEEANTSHIDDNAFAAANPIPQLNEDNPVI